MGRIRENMSTPSSKTQKSFGNPVNLTAIVNNTTMLNVLYKYLFGMLLSVLLDIPRSGIAELYVIVFKLPPLF